MSWINGNSRKPGRGFGIAFGVVWVISFVGGWYVILYVISVVKERL